MIISASRRTDIPALYMQWFMNRLETGEALVQNPMRPSQIRTVPLTRNHIDGIVFWTKNPEPMRQYLTQLSQYPFYILYTLNPYRQDIEPNLPKEEKRLDTFLRIAEIIGPDRIIWRYDPIIVTAKYTEAFHQEQFARIATRLSGATTLCKISFVHPYAKIRKALTSMGAVLPEAETKKTLAVTLQKMAEGAGMKMGGCCDPDLAEAGIDRATCVDAKLMGKIAGKEIPKRRDSGQRTDCSCCKSVDIGGYNTCTHGCAYCYANRTASGAEDRWKKHDPQAASLT